jgi:20S proteasome subunit beta 7
MLLPREKDNLVPQIEENFNSCGSYSYFDHRNLGGKVYHQKQYALSKRTQSPMVTGTSILGLKYQDGVMIAADTLASYGSLAKYRDVERIRPIGKYTLLAGSGDYSDFQHIHKMLEELVIQDELKEDGFSLPPQAIHSYLTRVMYQRRSKFDPLWNRVIIAGHMKGNSFLGFSDLIGTTYTDDIVTTGFGDYIARPLLRKHFKPQLSREEAQKLLEMCMRVLFYRDCKASSKIQIATITAEGVTISKPFELTTDWSVGNIEYENNVKVTTFSGCGNDNNYNNNNNNTSNNNNN